MSASAYNLGLYGIWNLGTKGGLMGNFRSFSNSNFV
jgi:hypothetical protein